jgi:hypothetical protein
MTERDAQDDHVGSQYGADARTATLKQVERYTCFRMARALDGQRLLLHGSRFR